MPAYTDGGTVRDGRFAPTTAWPMQYGIEVEIDDPDRIA
jgi:hypothetical protein